MSDKAGDPQYAILHVNHTEYSLVKIRRTLRQAMYMQIAEGLVDTAEGLKIQWSPERKSYGNVRLFTFKGNVSDVQMWETLKECEVSLQTMLQQVKDRQDAHKGRVHRISQI